MGTGLIKILCPNLKCRSLLSVPDTARGKQVRCRSCGMKVVVPGLATSRPAPVEPAAADSADHNEDK